MNAESLLALSPAEGQEEQVTFCVEGITVSCGTSASASVRKSVFYRFEILVVDASPAFRPAGTGPGLAPQTLHDRPIGTKSLPSVGGAGGTPTLPSGT